MEQRVSELEKLEVLNRKVIVLEVLELQRSFRRQENHVHLIINQGGSGNVHLTN